MTRAMILAAGFGTRMGALSDERPKPLVPVCDVSLIRYAIALLVHHGVRDIVINLHHRGELIGADLGDGAELGARVTYSHEATILGTGGGLRRALPLLGDETFLVVNGKIIVDLDLGDLLVRHRQSGAAATLVVRADAEAQKWNAIDAPAGGGPIRGFFGAGDFMFTGIHAIEPRLLARLPDDGQERCIVRQGYVPWLAAGEPILAYEQRGVFLEHSTPARYLAGNEAVLAGLGDLPLPPHAGPGIAPSAEIAPSARIIEPVRIGAHARILPGATVGPFAVVGAGARVDAGVRVAHAVVWPGAAVDRDAERAIVTPRVRVPAGAGDGG